MKKYSEIRNYKKFKSEYTKFVVFIKSGSYYLTYDADAMIMMYVNDDFRENLEYRIEKNIFSKVVKKLHSLGINVVLAGWKNSSEFYTDKMNNYDLIKKKAKIFYKSTRGSVFSSH